MTGKPPWGIFIAGTNTGVGKTHVATLLARTFRAMGERVGVYKPVLSGCRPNDQAPLAGCQDDDLLLWDAAGRPGELNAVSPQRFSAPLAPPQAAALEGRVVESDQLRKGVRVWEARSDVLLVEGAGGLFSPISIEELNADLALELALPVLLVGANRLGTVHAALSTWLAARTYRHGIPILGIVLSDVEPLDDGSRAWNAEELARRCAPTPVWRVPHGASLSPELAEAIRESWRGSTGRHCDRSI